MPVRIDKPLSLEYWRQMMSELDEATKFFEYWAAFQSATITDELKKILDHFGDQGLAATYAVRNGMIEAIWIDDHHNYTAVVFRKERGDPGDFVSILSIGGPPPRS